MAYFISTLLLIVLHVLSLQALPCFPDDVLLYAMLSWRAGFASSKNKFGCDTAHKFMKISKLPLQNAWVSPCSKLFSMELYSGIDISIICRKYFSDLSSVRSILKRGGRNFRKFEKNKDQNKKLFNPKSVRFLAQN